MTLDHSSKNAWRIRTEGPKDWSRKLVAGAREKYFIVSADSHINEPIDVFSSRISEEYRTRLPRVEVDETGTQWLMSEGWSPQPVKVPTSRTDLLPALEDFETYEVLNPYSERMEAEDVRRAAAARDLRQRLLDCHSEGVDAEIIFPQKGLLAFATPDPHFAAMMCHAWNEWVREELDSHWDRAIPMALIPTGDLDLALQEVEWAATHGFHGFLFPNRPIFNRVDQPRNKLEYNDKCFEPLWTLVAETGLPITFHVSTGEDPRAVGGNGGAIINYVSHAIGTTMEPMVQLIASGVFERHRSLMVGAVESGIGWIPWMLSQMDRAYRAHHMWVRPVIPDLPSDYFRRNCFATFIEEPDALSQCVNLGLERNVLWSNDYPHHEGSFPHSTVTIERSMADLNERQRIKVLGVNAKEIFSIRSEPMAAGDV